uniref:Uncharacterized protein n=1 Tax=Myripristis murdjan TaxID=586833 RepID=A0A667ZYG8_9TELE
MMTLLQCLYRAVCGLPGQVGLAAQVNSRARTIKGWFSHTLTGLAGLSLEPSPHLKPNRTEEGFHPHPLSQTE